MNVRQLVPDRSEIDDDQRAETHEPFTYAEGADRSGRGGLHKQPAICDERGGPPNARIQDFGPLDAATCAFPYRTAWRTPR
jgi:hypothetical protein